MCDGRASYCEFEIRLQPDGNCKTDLQAWYTAETAHLLPTIVPTKDATPLEKKRLEVGLNGIRQSKPACDGEMVKAECVLGHAAANSQRVVAAAYRSLKAMAGLLPRSAEIP